MQRHNFKAEMHNIAVTQCVMSTGIRSDDNVYGGFLG